MKKLSNKAELKTDVAYKKSVYSAKSEHVKYYQEFISL